jgi:ABC-type transport system involved in multi-copper enzyme maturation permease subunit
MALACTLIAYYQQAMRTHADTPLTYIAYIYKAVYDSFGRDIFFILSIILGSGGLLQEKSAGTVGFTLSLPASRLQLLAWRALVGYAGVLAIAATPVFVLPLSSHYVGQMYPVQQAFGFCMLWSAAGALFYGLTFLLSHLFEGEYTSVLLAIPLLLLYGLLAQLPWLARVPTLNMFNIISGEQMPFFDERLRILTSTLPWGTLTSFMAVAVLLIYVAARRTQSRDF